MILRTLLILLILIDHFAVTYSAPTATYTPRPTPLAGTYASAILADGPSAFWPLDEPAGAAVAGDLTGNGHYGTLSAEVTAGSAGPPTGDGDSAMAFHGADAVTVASMAGLPSGAHPYSLEAWVDMAGGGAANQGLVGYGDYGSSLGSDAVRLEGGTGIRDYWWNEDLGAGGSASLVGGWHQVVASYDGHGRRLYLDGAPFAADAPASQPGVVLANLALGRTCCGEYLTGSLANVAIYPYALTPAQVGRHYALGEHSPAPAPTASVLQYAYDAAGRLNSIVYPDGGRENHSDYDPAGRVTHISLPDGTDYYLSYNTAGQRTQIAYPNGGKQLWAYDGAGRPHDTWWAGPGGTVPFTQTATLDAAGQRTVLQDTAGSTAYGYDGAGRLTSASYPGGSTEADRYDGLGDRTVITSTTVLSGTAVTTNSFDAAAQLQTSAVSGGPQPGTTTYSYDGNGAQTGSSGPAGVTTNTFNWLGQLTHVSGPATSESFVYDGQGDRLRAYDQSTANYQLHTLAQDLRPGGMSGLLSDGAADYGYADFGVGAAPVARMDAGSSQGAYLASDLLGSVRLATNPSDQTLGSASYDAWGTARPVTPDAAGQVLLAGLQASAPFGYAGQAYDAGPGTYSMRARQYDPSTGRFQSTDPQAPSDQYPVTLNPYQYAGDMVTGTTDPSGRSWVWPYDDRTLGGSGTVADIYQQESLIGGSAPWKPGLDLGHPTPALGLSAITGSSALISTHATEYWVPVLSRPTSCGHLTVDMHSFMQTNRTWMGALQTGYVANVFMRTPGNNAQLWDIEPASRYRTAKAAHVPDLLVQNAQRYGVLWIEPHCFYSGAFGRNCGADPIDYHQSGKHELVSAGTGFTGILGLPTLAIDPSQYGGDALGHGARQGTVIDGADGIQKFMVWEQEPGLVLYAPYLYPLTCGQIHGPLACALLGISASAQQVSAAAYAYARNPANPGLFRGISLIGAAEYKLPDVLILGPSTALVSYDSTPGQQASALVDIGSNVAGGAVTGALLKQGLRLAGGVRDLAALQRLGAYLAASGQGIAVAGERGGALVANGVERSRALGRALLRLVAGCGHCFPAGTAVATAGGATAIEALHVGDTVLAEDPATGKVEPERVQAVIARPAAPLIALDLSDGSTLRVTADHPFWVDGGPGLAGAGWLLSGELLSGDRLRTADGRGVTVLRVRWNVGEAVVYTLTVATDHTFFVGAARVLVHNSTCAEIMARIEASLQASTREAREPGKVAHFLDQNGFNIHSFERKVAGADGNEITDIDIEVDNAIIEVTIQKKDKLQQGITLATNTIVNPGGKQVFLFSRKYSRFADSQFASEGIIIVRSEDELLARLKALKGP